MKMRTVARLSMLGVAAILGGCVDNSYETTDLSNRFEVAPSYIGVDEGIPVQMTATQGGAPQTVTWESSNTQVATVTAGGLVSTNCTPAGSATSCFAAITATKPDGSKKSSSVTVYNLVGQPLTNNVPVTVGGAIDDDILYRIYVPEGKTNLSVTMSGGSGDLDLYVRRATPPTTSSGGFTCRSWNAGNSETCTFTNPQAGTWYIRIDVYEDGAGASLRAVVTP
jgi:serine protease